MRRRFLQRKEPDVPELFCSVYSDCETIGISEDDDEHEEECPISEFRLIKILHGNCHDGGRCVS